MKTIKGDLIKLAKEGKFDVIVHGCNCFHTMGAGIARQIAREFPEAYIADTQTIFGSSVKMGTYSKALVKNEVGGEFTIINAYTQFDIASFTNPRPVSYQAIADVFSLIAHDFPDARIGYPAIGAGLARGNWADISEIIIKKLKGLNHTFVEFEP